VAVLDIDAGTITAIFPLGFKDHNLMENALDASNRDDGVNLTPYPNLFGMYQPDAMATFQVDGETYLVTANEGDSRDYDGFSEEARVKDLILDPAAFPAAADLQENEILGRLHVTTTLGQGPNGFEALYAYGARSFSIFKPTADAMELVFDSGSQFETLTAAMLPTAFNANNDDNDSFDSRSDDKGPEPEAVAVGVVDAKPYAFVGLERVGGIMVYDLSDPAAPLFVQYLNNRDFDAPVDSRNTGDLGVEGLAFISAAHSPTGKAMLAAANEVSGTTTLFTISADAPALPGDLDGNEIVDRDDTAIIRFHLRQPAAAFPAADIDGDGTITVLDARKLVRLCTCPRCLCR
jgi:hypothetical protein